MVFTEACVDAARAAALAARTKRPAGGSAVSTVSAKDTLCATLERAGNLYMGDIPLNTDEEGYKALCEELAERFDSSLEDGLLLPPFTGATCKVGLLQLSSKEAAGKMVAAKAALQKEFGIKIKWAHTEAKKALRAQRKTAQSAHRPTNIPVHTPSPGQPLYQQAAHQSFNIPKPQVAGEVYWGPALAHMAPPYLPQMMASYPLAPRVAQPYYPPQAPFYRAGTWGTAGIPSGGGHIPQGQFAPQAQFIPQLQFLPQGPCFNAFPKGPYMAPPAPHHSAKGDLRPNGLWVPRGPAGISCHPTDDGSCSPKSSLSEKTGVR